MRVVICSHNEKESHMNEHAVRVICGNCSREQGISHNSYCMKCGFSMIYRSSNNKVRSNGSVKANICTFTCKYLLMFYTFRYDKIYALLCINV
jgi:hypothetical protein